MDNGESSYRRFLAGDDSGFVEIIRDYKDGLIFYLNGFVDSIAVAEDLTEDTFVKIVTKKPRFTCRSSFKTWLYTIGRNVAIDYCRRHANRHEVPLEENTAHLAQEDDLLYAYIRKEQAVAVHSAMRKLKPAYRQVLWLTYFESFSNRETAAIMRKSTHSVETLLYRARKALKTILDKEGFSYEEF